MRGGPERFTVTSWLQIMDVQKQHEGDYTCVASSAQGHAEAVARVKVTDESEYHVTAGSAKELIAVHGRVNYYIN